MKLAVARAGGFSIAVMCLLLPSRVRADEAPEKSRQALGNVLRAGASAVDITPTRFPVIVNGNFQEAKADRAFDPLHARALVLDDGTTRIAITVVDNCLMPRDLLDRAKQLAEKKTGIPADHMLISATHTHSAPSAMGCLGSRADSEYVEFLVPQLARAMELAAKNLEPAKVGWTTVKDYEHTHCRRWIFRPDKMRDDPFGNRTVRANMQPGFQNPDVIGPSGPVDPDLSLLSVQSLDGRPLALLANYSMHYFGAAPVSADYYGRFCEQITKLLGADKASPAFVAILSQGTSGDQMWMEFGQPASKIKIDDYAAEVARVAQQAIGGIQYHAWAPLAMRESKITLDRRVPDAERLAWAQGLVAKIKDRLPQSLPEIYATEQVLLHDNPTAELKLQAVRIGELGITAIPDEVFALTGLKLKRQSPLTTTFNIELANGEEGYIPPPEQHKLGGYTTWPARTAGLEVQAEPKIVEAVLKLLEDVSGKPRRPLVESHGEYPEAVLHAKPLAYWRMNEMQGTTAGDATGHNHPGTYDGGVAFFLEGPQSPKFEGDGSLHRAVHFADGKLTARIKGLGRRYSVELWFWNGLPNDARSVTGYLFSNGASEAFGHNRIEGDSLAIGGAPSIPGRLTFARAGASGDALTGRTILEPKSWNHVVLARDGKQVRVYLNGNASPEISGEAAPATAGGLEEIYIGGTVGKLANFEGKIDEVAVYDRALSAQEAADHFKVSGVPPIPARQVLQPDPPRSPADSLAAIHVPEGFEVELMAAEPLVKSPVAIEWGADGKLWVVEMADYPLGMDGKMKAGGRIRYLEDSKGDGHYDKSTLFMEDINFPTGIIPWHNGVIVTAAPEIFYAEDTGGDGKADVRRTLYKGFIEGNPQLRVNGLRWALDGWVYCANGWSGGVARSEKTGATVDLRGRDLRIKPDEGLIDAESGVTEFGRNRNDWGDWFGCDNSYPLWHFVLEDHYIRRNPFVAPPSPKWQMMLPANPKVYARSKPQKRYHSFEQSGRFTSACGVMIYRDDLLFGHNREVEHAFVCEPVHNLVHHEIVREDGVSFASKPPADEHEKEFLASEDLWSRPVMVMTGPDGALWVVDMYRYMIEHPEWLPPEGKAELKPFFRAGEDRGRIYRVYPKGKRPGPIARLDKTKTVDLVASLKSSNGWQRDTAQRELLERKDAAAAIEPLQKLLADGTNPRARLHALTALATLNALAPEQVVKSLADPEPGIRRQALRLAETRAKTSPQIMDAVLNLLGDSAPKVRMQLACTLGECDDPRIGKALGELALGPPYDPYIAASALSSVNKRNIDETLHGVLAANRKHPVDPDLLGKLFGLTIALERDQTLVGSLPATLELRKDGKYEPWQLEVAAAMFEALGRRGVAMGQVVDRAGPPGQAALESVRKLVDYAARTALDGEASEADRKRAIRLMCHDPASQQKDLERLGQLLVPQTPASVQAAVVAHLGNQKNPAIAQVLLDGWKSHGPGLRSQILGVLVSRNEWLLVLLDKLEARAVLPGELDVVTVPRLIRNKDPQIQARAKKLVTLATDADRRKVLDDYQVVTTLSGDRQRGIAVFQKKCTVCHKLNDVGHEVGPNLASLTDKSPQTLLIAILDPSRNVEARFNNYVAQTSDGRSFSGVLAVETGNSITLRGPEGKEQVILRTELDALQSTGKSLMPDGLEKELTRQDLADLIAYIASQGPGH